MLLTGRLSDLQLASTNLCVARTACCEDLLHTPWPQGPGVALQSPTNPVIASEAGQPTSFWSNFCASSISKCARRLTMEIGTAGCGTKGAGWGAAGWTACSGAGAAFPEAAGAAAGAAPARSGSSHGVLAYAKDHDVVAA